MGVRFFGPPLYVKPTSSQAQGSKKIRFLEKVFRFLVLVFFQYFFSFFRF